MKTKLIDYLRCPECKSDNLDIVTIIKIDNNIKTGKIICKQCNIEYEIIDFIPRFVEKDNYTDSFGFEWNKIHPESYFDSDTGTKKYEVILDAFDLRADIDGKVMLEAGCGSGRKTEQFLLTGLEVVAFDYSNSVNILQKKLGHNNKLHIVQADINKLPFKNNLFDIVNCTSVIQHTPSPEDSFNNLFKVVKKNGRIQVDCYGKKTDFISKLNIFNIPCIFYPLTKRLPHEILFKLLDFLYPLLHTMFQFSIKIKPPFISRIFRWLIPFNNYNDDILKHKNPTKYKEATLLNAFDRLSCTYTNNIDFKGFLKWFDRNDIKIIKTRNGVCIDDEIHSHYAEGIKIC